MEVIFYLCIALFVAVCLLRPKMIIGFKGDKDAKQEEDTNKKGVI